MENRHVDVDRELAASFALFDFDQVEADYRSQNEFLFLANAVDRDLVGRMAAEVDGPLLHRSVMPWIRSAGHIGYRKLLQVAPTISALYQSPEMIALASRLAGKKLYLKSRRDDHACAIYHYTKPGDGMQYHYDTCGCAEGTSYTVILPLINESSQRFIAQLHKDDTERETEHLALTTNPGSMVLFCGSKVWHAVTPLGRDERRVVLSLAYASEPDMSTGSRFRENLKDAILYFGPSALMQRNYSDPKNTEASLEASNVVITGASSGIGEELAYQYAGRGARLALFARRRLRLEEVAVRCRELGAVDVLVIDGDTTDQERVREAAAEILDRWGHVDRAFLNAGGYGARTSEDLAATRDLAWTTTEFSAAATEKVMRLNYIGAVYWLEEMLGHMRERRSGTISVTGAMAGDRGHPKHGPYAATKAALRALFDSLRADAARYGIKLVILEPGCIVSGLTENNCCDDMPFLQPTDRAVSHFIDGVERGRSVVRFPLRGSLASRFMAVLPRNWFDRWATKKLPKV